jgi:hypothetical protein
MRIAGQMCVSHAIPARRSRGERLRWNDTKFHPGTFASTGASSGTGVCRTQGYGRKQNACISATDTGILLDG